MQKANPGPTRGGKAGVSRRSPPVSQKNESGLIILSLWPVFLHHQRAVARPNVLFRILLDRRLKRGAGD